MNLSTLLALAASVPGGLDSPLGRYVTRSKPKPAAPVDIQQARIAAAQAKRDRKAGKKQ